MGAVFERRTEKAGPSKLLQHVKARPSLITLGTSSVPTWKKETANVVHKHSVLCMCPHRHPHMHAHMHARAHTQTNITKEILRWKCWRLPGRPFPTQVWCSEERSGLKHTIAGSLRAAWAVCMHASPDIFLRWLSRRMRRILEALWCSEWRTDADTAELYSSLQAGLSKHTLRCHPRESRYCLTE